MKRAELIEKWLEALESGEYKQGHSFLINSNHYCCLGIACLVYGYDMEKLENRNETMLPENVSRKLGTHTLGEFRQSIKYRGESYVSLAALNDGGVRFKTIARIIREQMAKNNFAKP